MVSISRPQSNHCPECDVNLTEFERMQRMDDEDLVPEMLQALKAVVKVADRDTLEFNLARAAIAKAERISLGQTASEEK